MSAPVKPWEANYQRGDFASLSNDMSASPFQDRIQSAAAAGSVASTNSSVPPRLPPRPSEQTSSLNNRLGYGGGIYGTGGFNSMFGGGYGNYSSPLGYGGMYGSYGGYGGYGGYNYNRYGGDLQSSFARLAEESSRPAFESVNSIVQVVNSVSMMLDSTLQAVYNSFRAVIGVADNFSRLKSQLIQVFSALAFLRTLRYFFRKILEMLRLRPRGDADKLWSEAVKEAAGTMISAPDGDPVKSSWPIFVFFGIIMGGPYLIWKLISAFMGSTDENAWARGETDHFVAQGSFNFQGEGPEEVSFTAGQQIRVAPKELQPRVRGWLLASVDGNSTGMIPANYVKILGQKRGSKTAQPQVQSVSQSTNSPAQAQGIYSSPNSQAVHAVPEHQLESAFSVPFQDSTTATSTNVNVSDQEASDILSDAQK